MKLKILSISFFIVFLLAILSLFPAPAGVLSDAAPAQHNWVHETVLSRDTAELIGGTNYYLSSDVTVSSYLSVEGEEPVEICLNGYRLTFSEGALSVYGGTLVLWDCEGEQCTLENHMHKGEITGATDSAISIYNGGSLTMNGGVLTGNSAENGGGVFIKDGTFTMNGGAISDNVATGTAETGSNFSPAGGGGVYIENGEVRLNGGVISGNTAENGYGGGILLNATQVYYTPDTQRPSAPSVTFSLSDDALIGSNSARSGGGVALLGGVTAEMTGGTIGGKVYADGTYLLGNTSTGSGEGGGGAYLAGTSVAEPISAEVSPSFTMSGGTIGYEVESGAAESAIPEDVVLGNSAQNGGGVYVGDGAAFTLANGVIGYDISKEQFEAERESQTIPYGNVCTQEVNPGGGGIHVYGATFSMTGGKIVYIDRGQSYGKGGGIFATNKDLQEEETVVELTSGVISYNTDGAETTKGALLKMSGSIEVSDNLDFGIYAYEGGEFEMSGGVISGNFEGICLESSMLGNSVVTVTGGSITGNEIGILSSASITLGGRALHQRKYSGQLYDRGAGQSSGKLLGRRSPFFSRLAQRTALHDGLSGGHGELFCL